MNLDTLEKISEKKYFRTDKGKKILYGPNSGATGNNYWELYDEYFYNFKNKKINLLEFGFGAHGDCLRTFSEYFANANSIIGADYNMEFVEQLKFDDNKIKRYWVDQEQHSSIDDLIENLKSDGITSLDIVIDDGNHSPTSIKNCFYKIFPLLSDEGIYVIEDTYQIVKQTLVGKSNILSELQTLVYSNLNESWSSNNNFKDSHLVQSVFSYRGIIFVRKGKNITVPYVHSY